MPEICNTSSNWPDIKPDRVDELRDVIEEYGFPGTFGALDVIVHDGTGDHGSEEEPYLKIMGPAAFVATKQAEETNGSEGHHVHGYTEEFLERIAPYLEEQLVVRSIGRNDLEFPFLATQWSVWPDGTTRYDNFDNSPEKPDADD